MKRYDLDRQRASAGEAEDMVSLLTLMKQISNMWHDQEEWVRCRQCCFWDIGKNSFQIPLF